MGLVGKRIRLGRIFGSDGKAFVVPMDHGVDLGALGGIEDIKATVGKILGGGQLPDSILLNPSMIKVCHEEIVGKCGIIARLDGTATNLGPDITDYRMFSSVREAMTVGADAVASMAFIGVPRESQNSEKIGRITQDCEREGMPHVVEALPPEILDYHFKPKADRKWPSVENVKFVDRVAAELGADVVKSYYTGDPDSFREVVRCCPVPIIVLSGPGADDSTGLLQIVRDVMDSGANGVIMGRNVWGDRDPMAMIRAIRTIIHEDGSVEEATRILAP